MQDNQNLFFQRERKMSTLTVLAIFLTGYQLLVLTDGVPTNSEKYPGLTLKADVIHAVHKESDIKKPHAGHLIDANKLPPHLLAVSNEPNYLNKLSAEKHSHEIINDLQKQKLNAHGDTVAITSVPKGMTDLKTTEEIVGLNQRNDKQNDKKNIKRKKKTEKMMRKNKKKQNKLAKKRMKNKKKRLRFLNRMKQRKQKQGKRKKKFRLLNRKKGKKNKRMQLRLLLQKHLQNAIGKKSKKPSVTVKANVKSDAGEKRQLRLKGNRKGRKRPFLRKYLRLLRLMRWKKKGATGPKSKKKKLRMLKIKNKKTKSRKPNFRINRKKLMRLLKNALRNEMNKPGMTRTLIWPKGKNNKINRIKPNERKAKSKKQLRLLEARRKLLKGKRKMRKIQRRKQNKRVSKLNKLRDRGKNKKKVKCGLRCLLRKYKASRQGAKKKAKANKKLTQESIAKDLTKPKKLLSNSVPN